MIEAASGLVLLAVCAVIARHMMTEGRRGRRWVGPLAALGGPGEVTRPLRRRHQNAVE